jgi:hypothetical protein
MFKFSGAPADTTSNEFNDNFVQGMNNQKIQNTHRASIKAKVNQVLTDKPSTWPADKGKKRDIRHIVNTNAYYKTVKKQYNKNPKAGTDAAVAHADKVIPPVLEKRNSWFKVAKQNVTDIVKRVTKSKADQKTIKKDQKEWTGSSGGAHEKRILGFNKDKTKRDVSGMKRRIMKQGWFKGAYGGVPMSQPGDAYRIKNTTLDYQSDKGSSFSSSGSQKNLRTGVTLHDNLSESKKGVVTDNVVKIDPSSGNFVGELQTGKNITSLQGSGVLDAVKQVGKHTAKRGKI